MENVKFFTTNSRFHSPHFDRNTLPYSHMVLNLLLRLFGLLAVDLLAKQVKHAMVKYILTRNK